MIEPEATAINLAKKLNLGEALLDFEEMQALVDWLNNAREDA